MPHLSRRALLRAAAPLLLLSLSASGITSGELIRFTDQVNEFRRAAGCAPLQWDEGIADIAQKHSADMLRRDFFDHTDPDGVTLQQRIRVAGFTRRGPAGENISYGQSYSGEAFKAWIDSPNHRENLEYCRFTHHGLGREGPYWTHTFITLTPEALPDRLPPPRIRLAPGITLPTRLQRR